MQASPTPIPPKIVKFLSVNVTSLALQPCLKTNSGSVFLTQCEGIEQHDSGTSILPCENFYIH